jgi:hypothetical protein
MGFSGGGSNVLLPHSHDGRVSQDGGPLDFNNITQSQSAAGEVFYSDGTALQQLVYPAVPAGETLTAAALSTAPSWVAAAAATTVWTELVNTKVVGASVNIDESWVGTYNILKIFFYGAPSAANKTGITFNSDNGTVYSSAGDAVYTSERTNYLNDLTTGDFGYTAMDVYNIADKEKQGHVNTTIFNTGTNAIYKFESWQAWQNTVDLIQSVQVCEKNAGTLQTYLADSHLVILGAN